MWTYAAAGKHLNFQSQYDSIIAKLLVYVRFSRAVKVGVGMQCPAEIIFESNDILHVFTVIIVHVIQQLIRVKCNNFYCSLLVPAPRISTGKLF